MTGMSRCRNCGAKPYIFVPYLKQELCRSCFLAMVEQRVRMNLRHRLLSGENDRVAIAEGTDAATAAARHILKKIFDDMHGSELVYGEKQGYELFVCRSLEQECKLFFRHVLLGEDYRLPKNPTMNVPQRELEEYCRAKDLKFREESHKDNEGADVLHMLERIRAVRPGALFGTIKMVQAVEDRNS